MLPTSFWILMDAMFLLGVWLVYPEPLFTVCAVAFVLMMINLQINRRLTRRSG